MIKFLKKIAFKVYTFFHYLFYGLRSADNIMLSQNTSSTSKDQTGIEQQDLQDSVYKDLLRGEVTQEVRELRHETYYAERESHKYKYIGNGVAIKKNEIFSNEIQGIERSDNFDVELIQNNVLDTGGIAKSLGPNDELEYTLKIKRSFNPRFRIERHTSKLVVKRIDDVHVMLDFYVTKYESQFDRRHRPFLNELERVYQGYKESDIVNFDELSFVTFRAYGAPDLIEYSYHNIVFDYITEYNGDFVLKFVAEIKDEPHDITMEFYDDKAAEKFEKKAPRKGKNTFITADFTQKPDEDDDEVKRLLKGW